MELYLAFVLLFLGLIVLVGSLDDIVVDLLKWWMFGSSKSKTLPVDATDLLEKKPTIAIFVANWHEADVLGPMVERNLANFTYDRATFVLGVYPNDTSTVSVAIGLAERFPDKVEVVVNRRDGPTSKGQMLNEMFGRIFARDRAAPDLVVMHDSEDVISPRSFEVYALESREHAMIQIPIFSLDSRDRSLVAATYMEEFAERHTGEMLLRERLGSFVPSAGVGTCLRKDLIERFLASRGYVLQPGSVTEDYVLGAEAHQAGFSTAFASYRDTQLPTSPIIATLEYFPKEFWSSLRQRTRWTFGVGFESAKRLGWFGSAWNRFFLYRDRKGAVANFLPLLSLLVLAACLIVSPDFSAFAPWQRALLITVLAFNSLNIVLRVYQKAASLMDVYGGYDLLGLLARWPVALLINAMAAARAWRSFIVESGLASRPIAWAKTQHELPVSFQIFGAQAAPALAGDGPRRRRRVSVRTHVGGAVAMVCLLLVVAGGLRVYGPLISPVTKQLAEVLNPQEIDSEERRIVESGQTPAGLDQRESQTASVKPKEDDLAQRSRAVSSELGRAVVKEAVQVATGVRDEQSASRPADNGQGTVGSNSDHVERRGSNLVFSNLSQDAKANGRKSYGDENTFRANVMAQAEISLQTGAQKDAALIAGARPAPLGDALALLQAIDPDERAGAAGATDDEPDLKSVAQVMESRDEIELLAEAGLSIDRQMDLTLIARSIPPSPDQHAAERLVEADAEVAPEPVRVEESRDDTRSLAVAGIDASRVSDQSILAQAIPATTELPGQQLFAALANSNAVVSSKEVATDYVRGEIRQMARNSLSGAKRAEDALTASAVPAERQSKPKATPAKWRSKLTTAKLPGKKASRRLTRVKLPAKKKAPVRLAAPPAGEWAEPAPKKSTTFLRRRCQGTNCGLPGVGPLTKASTPVLNSS